MECAGVGLSAIAALAGQSFEKRRWRIIPRALRKFVEAKLRHHSRYEMDDIVVEASSRIVTVSNAPLMGNNMLAAPGAKMDDGLLDVQIYDGMGDAALVRALRGRRRRGRPTLSRPTAPAAYALPPMSRCSPTPTRASPGSGTWSRSRSCRRRCQ